LKCFIKHEAWNDFGEGKFVILPIQLDNPFAEQQSKIPQLFQNEVKATTFNVVVDSRGPQTTNEYVEKVLKPNEINSV
jgi:hypothetical protein